MFVLIHLIISCLPVSSSAKEVKRAKITKQSSLFLLFYFIFENFACSGTFVIGITWSMFSATWVSVHFQSTVIIFAMFDILIEHCTVFCKNFDIFRIFSEILTFSRIFRHVVKFFSVTFQIVGVFVSWSTYHASGSSDIFIFAVPFGYYIRMSFHLLFSL